MSRGSALIEVLVVGFLVALLVLQLTATAGRLQAAGERATEAAQVAAEWGARHGDAESASAIARRLLPDASVNAQWEGSAIEVVVRVRVPLIGPEGSPLAREVVGRASAQISPYRSNRE